MGCVVLHPATANAAATASTSGRLIIFSNCIEFLIVIPLTDFCKRLRACRVSLATKSNRVCAVRFSLTNYATYPAGSVRQRP
jgi:hypothetical protein